MEHKNLHLLAIERTGWRRWLFGRWVYRSEPFRRDIQRKIAATKSPLPFISGLKPWEQMCAPEDYDK